MWLSQDLPATRIELHYGDRIMRCFAERPHSLHALLSDAVAANPHGEALICGDLRLSYRELDREVGRVAAGLAARGIGKGDRVALLLGNRPEFVLLVLAAARLGAISVPLNVREQTPGLRHLLGDSGASLLVHDAGLAGRLPPLEALPALRHRIELPEGTYDYAALCGRAPVTDAVPVDEEEAAALLYTSGTTGLPKGAMLTGLGIVHSAIHFQVCMGLGAGDRTLVAVPLSHVTGLVALMATALRAAGTLIVMPAFRAPDFLALAARERMTHTILVPAMYNLCLLQPDFDGHDLSAWRVGSYGGAPMPEITIAKLAQTLPNLKLMNAYGATETTSPATIMPPAETARRSDSVGRAVPCGRVLVMDDAGRQVAPGEEGEVWIAGPMVVPGYWQNAQATAREFTGGFWRSGDIGSMDADGFLRVFDRKKDMINRGGYKIYGSEVENVLLAHPDVIEAAVVAKACPVLGERVHAFVVSRSGTVDVEALQRHCAAQLSDYKVPESFSCGAEPLPRNANGKVLKRRLREQLASGQTAAGPRQ